jgi:hypothetical protein
MKVDYAFCAKYAEVGSDGLFSSIGGGLEVIQPNQLPGAIPTITLVFRVAIPLEECQSSHQLCVELFGPTKEKLPLEVEIPVAAIGPRVDVPELTPAFCCAINMANVLISLPGDYEFRISADGKAIGAAVLYVQPAAQVEVKA